MMRIESAAVAGVCIVAVGCSMSASKPRGFIGDTGEGWNTTSNVRVRASGEKPTREAIHIIDGSGIDPTGRFHTHYLYPACLLYTSPSPRALSTSRMPSSA